MLFSFIPFLHNYKCNLCTKYYFRPLVKYKKHIMFFLKRLVFTLQVIKRNWYLYNFWITIESTVYSHNLNTNGVTKSHDIQNNSSMWLCHRINKNIVLSKRRLRRQPTDMITHERKNVIFHTTTIKYQIFTKPKLLLLLFSRASSICIFI